MSITVLGDDGSFGFEHDELLFPQSLQFIYVQAVSSGLAGGLVMTALRLVDWLNFQAAELVTELL